VFDYTYDALNRATQAVCSLSNIPGFTNVQYQIDYAFDPVGNVTNRVITGLQGMSDSITTRYEYNMMNRLTNVVQLTNNAVSASAWYSYDAAGRLWQKGYGNDDVVTHSYDAESRLLTLGITNNSTLITCYSYGWDAGGNILAITNNGTNITLYGYDAAGQLTNEVCGAVTNAWVYDEAGNWLGSPGAAGWKGYNADNELVGVATNTVTVTGEVEPGPSSNKWYSTWADCRGVSAKVSTNDGTFSLSGVPLYAGTNALVVTVTDVSGNSTQQVRTVVNSMTNCLETFAHDGNGNLTNWVCGSTNWVYQWDWADRLVKVSSNGVAVLENWYDAQSRRIAKSEVISGQTKKWLYLHDGWDIVAAMNEAGQLRESYMRGVGLAGDIGTLVAVTHHPGSSTNGTFYAHHNHRGDIVATRSGTTTVGSYSYSAFGLQTSAFGPDVCRFKFSSKERDVSTGFSYCGYRFYSAQWQRWVSPDWVGEADGSNPYCPMKNGPVVQIDPYGEATVKVWAKFAACFACGACAGVLGLSCAAICAGGHWDDPGESFGDCWAKCVAAGLDPKECPAFTATCIAACTLCGILSTEWPSKSEPKVTSVLGK